MTTNDLLINSLVSCTKVVQHLEQLEMPEEMRFHIHRALLCLTTAVSIAAPLTIAKEDWQ